MCVQTAKKKTSVNHVLNENKNKLRLEKRKTRIKMPYTKQESRVDIKALADKMSFWIISPGDLTYAITLLGVPAV